jgi:hypothetical protein
MHGEHAPSLQTSFSPHVLPFAFVLATALSKHAITVQSNAPSWHGLSGGVQKLPFGQSPASGSRRGPVSRCAVGASLRGTAASGWSVIVG